jgi:hypothetical protein
VRLLMETFTDLPPLYVWEPDLELMQLCQLGMGSDELAAGGRLQVRGGGWGVGYGLRV